MKDPKQTQNIEALLEHLRSARGFDFTGYKRASLTRRIEKRMSAVGVAGYADYIEYLELHPGEFEQLFNTILINVTAFFRDREVWDTLAAQTLARSESADGAGPIRLWSAGCASGEEAYTLAIALAERMGVDQFRERVKIYATDIDDHALAAARRATYSAKQVAGVPDDLREKYFEKSGKRFSFRKDLRRCVIFGRIDMIQDAPISRIDLLVCSNTLMYFTAETQARILSRFHFALNEGGLLFLGHAGMLLAQNALFKAVDPKRRVFTTVVHGDNGERAVSRASSVHKPGIGHLNHFRLREAAMDGLPLPRLIVDVHGVLVMANALARELFAITPDSLGRPLQDLEVSYRPAELRSRLDLAFRENKSTKINDVSWTMPGSDTGWYDLTIDPVRGSERQLLGAAVTFIDITRTKRLQLDLERSAQELEAAHTELQATNEELETTNEELQSTIEELETTNEELQSTNEELETTNEELQSTNEELVTINDELRLRSRQIHELNLLLEAILASFQQSVVVVDPGFRVLAWNQISAEMWGLREDEVMGKNLDHLDIGLPVEYLVPIVKACLLEQKSRKRITVDATNRRGKAIRCRFSCTPLITLDGETRGAVLMMKEMDRETEQS